MTRRATTVDGVSVAYDTGGGGQPVVFVHGLGDDRLVWTDVVNRMNSRFACASLDLRGHGETTGVAIDFDPFGLVRDIDAVVHALGLARPALVGHSLGGFAVSVYAASRPCSAVVNIDQPLELRPLAASARAMRPALDGQLEPVWRDILTAVGIGPMKPDAVERLRTSRARVPREAVLGLWGPFFAGNDEALEARMSNVLRAITIPYLSVHGAPPPDDYAFWLHDRVPQAVVETWPGAGHFPHVVAVERLAARITAFLESR